MAESFRRKRIRLAAENYRGRRMYFGTICFASRRRFGANGRVAAWLIKQMRRHAAESGFFVHAYCVMPDHVHLLVDASGDESNLIAFVRAFKQQTGFEFARRTRRQLWQLKYYDRVLRGRDSPEAVAWYIWMNPVRKGICGKPSEYPFLGSFTEIGAKLLKSSTVAEWTPPWKGSSGKSM